MAPLIGAWWTGGEGFGADGRTVMVTVAGSDAYEELGPPVVTTLMSRLAAHDVRCPDTGS